MKYPASIFNLPETIIVLESQNNDGIIPHSHEFIELVYISNGKGLHNIQGKTHVVSTGDLFLISTQDEHSLRPLPDGTVPFQWVNCIFLPRFIDFDFSVFPPDHTYLDTEGLDTHYLFKYMLQEFLDKKEGYLNVLKSCLQIILIRLSRQLNSNSETASYTHRKMNNDLKRALDYIHLHFRTRLTLNDICSTLQINPTYLGKLFRELKGSSPIDYTNRCRIEQSCKLLLETDWPIHHIIDNIGLRDPKFFYLLFKRTTGMTPGEYRSKYRLITR